MVVKVNWRVVGLGAAFAGYHALDFYAGLTHGWVRLGLVVVSGLFLLAVEPPLRRHG